MLIDLIAAAEFAIIIICAVVAKLLYLSIVLNEGSELFHFQLAASVIGAALLVNILRAQDLYAKDKLIDWRGNITTIYLTLGLTFLILIAIGFLFKVSADYSRGWLLTWFGLTYICLTATRFAAARYLPMVSASRYAERRIAFVADSAQDVLDAHKSIAKLKSFPGITIAGIFRGPNMAANGLRDFDELIALAKSNGLDEVVLAPATMLGNAIGQALDELGDLPIDVWLYPAELTVPIYGTAKLGSMHLLQLQTKPIRNWGYVSKLVLDYSLSSIAIVLLSPLMLLIAIAIKLDTRGPVFFRQTRHGFNHREVGVFKFRTMNVIENGPDIKQAVRNDPRVTRVGHILRKTSLDELPQLFNVLRGEMSLVGPRPHAVAHNSYYSSKLERYAKRHCVKPGITGLAQINGLRGPTDDSETMRKRVEMDLEYIANWSIWLDFKILALTPIFGLVNKNAV